MNKHVTVGERLNIAIKLRGLSQKEVAEQLDTTEATISRYVKGTREPKLSFLIKFCNTYNVSADWILGLMGEI